MINKTFDELSDELAIEMNKLKKKYPDCHLSKSEKQAKQLSDMFDNFNNFMSDFAKTLKKMSSAMMFHETGSSVVKGVHSGIHINPIKRKRDKLLFYGNFLPMFLINIWFQIVKYWPEEWLPELEEG